MKHLLATLIPSAFLLISGCGEGTEAPTTTAPTSSLNQDPVVAETAEPVPPQETTDTASPINAETVLAAALTSAKEQNKRVLVHLGAPW